MAIIRAILLIVGVLAVLMGGLWIGQGLDIIRWPASSFMLADKQWAVNGAILAVIGLGAIWFARRRSA
ncbi:MAG TPA: hypothetical protein VHG29_00725 [Novosphingobium sp.]|nr:hypothetical protein [Novosphingobium sp.]